MKMRLALLKEILLRPLFLVVEVILAFLGNYDTITSRVPVLETLVAKIISTHLVSVILFWLSNNWLYLFLLYLALAIFNGMFEKAKPYLGEKISTNKVFLAVEEERPIVGDLYAWIRVQNEENADLQDCYATLRVVAFNLHDRWINCTDSINPNQAYLDWPVFKSGREVVIRRGSPGRINIFRADTDGFAFVFSNGDVHIRNDDFTSSSYYIEVCVGGTLYGKPIQEKEIHGFIEFVSQEKEYSSHQNNRLFIRVSELDAPLETLDND